jgi:hypothetical protein
MADIRKIFVFSFSGWETPGEPEVEKRGFILTFKDKEEMNKFADWTMDDDMSAELPEDNWYEFLGEMEGYGVHDFCTSGWAEIVGYHTYEIRLDKRDEVMNKWRDYIVNHGYECGPILTGLKDEDWEYPELELDTTTQFN